MSPSSSVSRHPETGEGRSPLNLVHPGDRAAAEQALARAFRSGVPQIITCRQQRPDGSYAAAEFRADPGFDVSVPVAPMVQGPDETWTIAESLGETADAVRAAKVIEQLHGAAFAFDAKGRFTYATPVAQTSIAMTLEDLNRPLDGAAFLDGGDFGWKLGVHADDYPAAAAHLRTCMRTGEPYDHEYRVLRASGEYVWHRFSIRPVRDGNERISGWYGIGFDIDVYKKTEGALRERERELSQLIDMVPSHLWRLTPEGEPIFFNRRMVEFLGMDVADTLRLGMTRLEVMIEAAVHPDDQAAFSDTLSDCLATGEPFALRYRLRRYDGAYHWMSSRAAPLRDPEGRIVQWYGLCHDIDDQVSAEEALRESEQQLRRLVDALPTQIWAATAQGEPSYLNRRLAEYVGITLDDLDVPDTTRLQVAIQGSVHPDDARRVGEALVHAFRTGETFAMKYRQRRADGVYRWISGRAEPLRDAHGLVQQWYGVSFDIDDDVRTQEELRRTREKLAIATQAASLAELSASIAHEVNQPLAAVVANSHASQRWLSADPPNLDRARAAVERVIRDANGAADVVGRIRALFKQSGVRRTATMIGSVVAEARELLAEEASRRDVRIEVEVEPSLPPIALDRVQIQQVLINLMRNGIEAMVPVAGERKLHLAARKVANMVRAEVSDFGPGIEFPERMFEPFFTTKTEGMGMGLAISRSIVESHGGRLWAENNEPHGARFFFTLPLELRNEQ